MSQLALQTAAASDHTSFEVVRGNDDLFSAFAAAAPRCIGSDPACPFEDSQATEMLACEIDHFLKRLSSLFEVLYRVFHLSYIADKYRLGCRYSEYLFPYQ